MGERHILVHLHYDVSSSPLVLVSLMIHIFIFNIIHSYFALTSGVCFKFTRGVTFVLVIVLVCCGDIRRKVPLNFIFLGLFVSIRFNHNKH